MLSKKDELTLKSSRRRSLCSSLLVTPKLQSALSPVDYRTSRNSFKFPLKNTIPLRSNFQDQVLGPGYYSGTSTKEPGGFQFSTTGRFNPAPEEKWKYVLTRRRNLSEEQKSAINQRIDRNKEVSKFSHQNKISRIQEKRRKREIRSEINWETHQKILNYTRKQKEHKYTEKMKKYYYRSLKENFSKVVKGWLSLYMVLGCAKNIEVAIKRKKELKARTFNSIQWLYWVSRSVGRMIILSRKVKRNRAIRAIKPWLRIYALKWLGRKKQLLGSRIINFIDNFTTEKIGLRLMATWKQRILFIQRQLKQALVSKSLLYEILITRWSTIEAQILQSRSGENLIRSKTPKEVKKLYLKEEIRKEVKRYNLAMNKYNNECQKIKKRFLQEGNFESGITKYFPVRPELFKVLSLIDTRKLKFLVLKAEEERPYWKEFLQAEENKTTRFSKLNNKIL